MTKPVKLRVRRYRIVRYEPHPLGAFVTFGGMYRWLWAAKLSAWMYGFFPDLHGYSYVEVEQLKKAKRV